VKEERMETESKPYKRKEEKSFHTTHTQECHDEMGGTREYKDQRKSERKH